MEIVRDNSLVAPVDGVRAYRREHAGGNGQCSYLADEHGATAEATDGHNLVRVVIYPVDLRGELGELPRDRVQQADHVGGLVDQGEEALRGGAGQEVTVELRELCLDALAGGDVEEATPVAAGARRRGLLEHDPLAREEAAVEGRPRRPAATHGTPPGSSCSPTRRSRARTRR
uniref:Uncharacterized protein n=1 Tax=Setaria viridis TaxID=4556 RepID=A0A4U6VZD5_SETVI|nr:hypothetical protein SEVIR_2G371600v2 [Setaria viridis]